MNRGAVSTTPEADLCATVRKHGVVSRLDADGRYTAFVDRLVASRAVHPEQVPFALLAYRGSHLALMLEAEGLDADVEGAALVIHLPRFTEDRVNPSPELTAPMPKDPLNRPNRPVAPRSICVSS